MASTAAVSVMYLHTVTDTRSFARRHIIRQSVLCASHFVSYSIMLDAWKRERGVYTPSTVDQQTVVLTTQRKADNKQKERRDN